MEWILSNLVSGRLTTPILGSMVQNGKFSAGILASVRALNRLDLPTFGSPTIPHFNATIGSLKYEEIFVHLLYRDSIAYLLLSKIYKRNYPIHLDLA